MTPDTSVTERVAELEEVLRGLASTVGAGGYNAETVDPDVFDRKIRWGIDHLINMTVQRCADVIEEQSKNYAKASYGDCKRAVLALKVPEGAAISSMPSLEEESARLNQRLVETQMLAFKWMEAHDCLHAGKSYSFPKPADLPDRVKALEEENARLREALETVRRVLEEGQPAICCTVWVPDRTSETLLDHVAAALDYDDSPQLALTSPREGLSTAPALDEAHAAMRWVYRNGMAVDHDRPEWVSKAFSDAFAKEREGLSAGKVERCPDCGERTKEAGGLASLHLYCECGLSTRGEEV